MGDFFGGIAGRLGMNSWTQSGALLAGGALLIALPIIIHLLNKRRFKTVYWAAMEFLIDADRKNRRRVQLENLLLLLMRCLIVLLLAALVARPFVPTQLTGGLLGADRVEHVVLLDDSMSMQTVTENSSSLDRAKERLVQLVNGLQKDSQSHLLTLAVTSDPKNPLLSEKPITPENIAEAIKAIESIEGSDSSARLIDALDALEEEIAEGQPGANRQIYVISDMRQVDWATDNATESEKGPTSMLRNLAKESQGCYVVDVGSNATSNLVITDVELGQKSVVAGSTSRFRVTVRNNGIADVDGARLRFTAGDGSTQEKEVPKIERGRDVVVPFRFTFAANATSVEGGKAEYLSEPVQVELIAPSGGTDLLSADNVRYFPARITSGTQVLLVDGDLSSNFELSESYYLRLALNLKSSSSARFDVQVFSDVKFESATLSDYEVIYLLNIDTLNESRIAALEEWVADGGGLVIAPGFQADHNFYNQYLYKGGEGLLPYKLVNIQGDEQERDWVGLSVGDENHLAYSGFAGTASHVLSEIKVFQHWRVNVDEEKLREGEVSVPMRFVNDAKSPAITEQAYGDGRVIAFSIPLDKSWSNFTNHIGAYIPIARETTKYLAGSRGDQGQFLVGEVLEHQIDTARYSQEATIVPPEGNVAPVIPLDRQEEEGNKNDSHWLVGYTQTYGSGIYRLQLRRHQSDVRAGDIEEVMYAMNVDPLEGDLARAEPAVLKNRLGDDVEMVSASSDMFSDMEGGQTELWRRLLVLLVIVLCGEQFLAMWFARKR